MNVGKNGAGIYSVISDAGNDGMDVRDIMTIDGNCCVCVHVPSRRGKLAIAFT